MAMTRSSFLNLMVAGLRKVFFDQYKALPSQYADFYQIEKSGKRREDFDSVVGIGMTSEKEEGVALTYADFAMGYSKQFTHTAYAKGIRITRELLDDELYGVMKRRAKALARGAAYRKEYEHAKLFNNASATTYFTCGDGLAVLSASHTLAGVPGTTYSNTSASTDLSQAALETAFNAMARYVDDMNLLINVDPGVLLIPPESLWDATEILQSAGKAYTADNETNALKGRLKIVTWPFITDTDSWFVLARKGDIDGGLMSFNRTALEFDRDGDFDTKDLKVSCYERFSNGIIDPRCLYGSMGG